MTCLCSVCVVISICVDSIVAHSQKIHYMTLKQTARKLEEHRTRIGENTCTKLRKWKQTQISVLDFQLRGEA